MSINSLSDEDLEKAATLNKLAAKLKQQIQEQEEFYKSDKCEYIINQLKKYDYVLSCADVNYMFDKTCELFRLENISEDDLHMFLNVMSSPTVGQNDLSAAPQNNLFTSEFTTATAGFMKRGLIIDIICGQGCSVFVYNINVLEKYR